MRKLIVNAMLSLDGVMQAPGGPDEDTSGGFAYGGWTVPFWDDTMGEVMDDVMSKPFDLVLGRKTYEIFAGYWPNAPEEAGGRPLNDAKKYVASTTLTSLEWEHSVLLEGDVREAIAALKEEDGPVLITYGSTNLLQTLLQANLIDEFRLMTFPVVLGSGKRLFYEGTMPAGLELAESRVSPTGVVYGRYAPTGPVKTGSF